MVGRFCSICYFFCCFCLFLTSVFCLKLWLITVFFSWSFRKNRGASGIFRKGRLGHLPIIYHLFYWEFFKNISKLPKKRRTAIHWTCLRADVSYFLCCTRKRDVCVTPSLIVFQRPAGFPRSWEHAVIGWHTVRIVWLNADWLLSNLDW